MKKQVWLLRPRFHAVHAGVTIVTVQECGRLEVLFPGNQEHSSMVMNITVYGFERESCYTNKSVSVSSYVEPW